MKYRIETNVDPEDLPLIDFDDTDGGSLIIHLEDARTDGIIRIKASPDVLATPEPDLLAPLYGYDWKLQTFEDDEGQMGIRCDVTPPGTPVRGLGLALTAAEAIRLALADFELKTRVRSSD